MQGQGKDKPAGCLPCKVYSIVPQVQSFKQKQKSSPIQIKSNPIVQCVCCTRSKLACKIQQLRGMRLVAGELAQVASRVDRRQRDQAQIRRPPFCAVPRTIQVRPKDTGLASYCYRSRARWRHIVAVVSPLTSSGAGEASTRARTVLTGTRVHCKDM